MTASQPSQPEPASSSNPLAEIARALADKKLPPVDKWNPPYCGAVLFRITRDGTWFYQGSPIGRPALVKLFSTVLRLDADGRHYLVTPAEKVGVDVDVAPFLAVELISEGEAQARRIGFRLNTDDAVIVDAAHPLRITVDPATGEPTPLVHVRKGLMALIHRPVFYELVALALDECPADGPVGLWSDGHFYRLDGTP
jgi:hypothetical protein